MRLIKKLNLILSIVFFITSCAIKKPISSNYFENNKRVGVVYNIDTISIYKEGAQGLLDIALTIGKRFREPLAIVDKKINPTKKIKNLYSSIFSENNKDLSEIDFVYNKKVLKRFNKPSNSNKKFHKYDLRNLKSKGIDELLIVNVHYGLMISYYSMIELGRAGNCQIDSEIVDLSDNSIIFKDSSKAKEKIKGKWKTPPEYENLKNAINIAINKSIESEKIKFNK